MVARSCKSSYGDSLAAPVTLDETKLSCVAWLSQWEGGEISVCFRLSCLDDALPKGSGLSVNTCATLQLHSVSSSPVVFLFFSDPGPQVETVSTEVETWQW